MSLFEQRVRRVLPRVRPGLLPEGPLAYVDIETTSLSAYAGHVTVVGIVTPTPKGRLLRQWFVEDPDDEPDVLDDVVGVLKSVAAVVTYNGHSFDLPFLRARARAHGVGLPWIQGWDLLHEARALRRATGAPGSCTLQSVMDHFGLVREDSTGGAAMVEAYEDWLYGGDEDARDLILDHNADDLLSLPELGTCLTRALARASARTRKVSVRGKAA